MPVQQKVGEEAAEEAKIELLAAVEEVTATKEAAIAAAKLLAKRRASEGRLW